ncbi:hypothetical protein HDU76_013035 [Blyttiomyces sp. JEL0837]|nr:hypothetical protein HDU76_013035 [Blyttiomyces sp. JEL0837]
MSKRFFIYKGLIAISGQHTALYDAYRLFPKRLTVRLVKSLMERGAKLPRFLILCLFRERLAEGAFKEQVKKHLVYRQQVQEQLAQRTRALEEQRKETEQHFLTQQEEEDREKENQMEEQDDKDPETEKPNSNEEDGPNPLESLQTEGLNIKAKWPPKINTLLEPVTPTKSSAISVGLLPLPFFPEIPVVPAPQSLPSTPTSLLSYGIRDFLIDLGKEVYGNFLESPLSNQDDHVSAFWTEPLHWMSRIAITPVNPIFVWPPDDAFMFNYLLKYGDGSASLAKPEVIWTRVSQGIKTLLDQYGFSPALIHGRKARAILPWIEQNADRTAALPSRTKDVNQVIEHHVPTWLPSELFCYDRSLALFLARIGDLPQKRVNDEVVYWTLIESKVHILPKKHTPIIPSEENSMLKLLKAIPSPIPVQPIRRLVLGYPSKICVSRLSHVVSKDTLQTIGESTLAELLGHVSSYGGSALNLAEAIVSAFSLSNDDIAKCFLLSAAEIAQDYNDDEEYHSEVVDVLAAYDEDKNDGTSFKKVHRYMRTRIGRISGTIPWTHWKWVLGRFQAHHEIASACLNDLALRDPRDDPSLERQWQFAEKEADAAVKHLLSVGVLPVPDTLRNIAKKALKHAIGQREGFAGGYLAETSVIPPRCVAIMATVERMLIDAAGPRVIVSEAVAVDPENVGSSGSLPQKASSEEETAEERVEVTTIDQAFAKDEEVIDSPVDLSGGHHISPDLVEEVQAWATDVPANVVSNGVKQSIDNNEEESPFSAEESREEIEVPDAQAVTDTVDESHRLPPRNSNHPVEELIVKAKNSEFYERSPMFKILVDDILASDGWYQMLGSEANSANEVVSAEARFYWGVEKIIRAVVDLTEVPKRIFDGWESEVYVREANQANPSGPIKNVVPQQTKPRSWSMSFNSTFLSRTSSQGSNSSDDGASEKQPVASGGANEQVGKGPETNSSSGSGSGKTSSMANLHRLTARLSSSRQQST